MEQRRAQPGSITILFAVILVCVTVLAVLCVSTARADLAMAENFADATAKAYAVEAEGQRWLSRVDAALAAGTALPEGTSEENGEIAAALSGDGVTLNIRLRPLDGAQKRYEILAWSRQAEWTQDTQLDLW